MKIIPQIILKKGMKLRLLNTPSNDYTITDFVDTKVQLSVTSSFDNKVVIFLFDTNSIIYMLRKGSMIKL